MWKINKQISSSSLRLQSPVAPNLIPLGFLSRYKIVATQYSSKSGEGGKAVLKIKPSFFFFPSRLP